MNPLLTAIPATVSSAIGSTNRQIYCNNDLTFAVTEKRPH